ncbi:MAG: adenosylcobinamide-GDP ribazoletransferase [Acidimicrobiales bacterium]
MRAAFGFLTILPYRGSPTRVTLASFVMVGLVVGTVVATVGLAVDAVTNPSVAGVAMVISDLVVTGLLHVDGVADCGDGLIVPMDRSRRRAVMKSPELGAFGVVVVVVVVLARYVGFSQLLDARMVWNVVPMWALSRLLMATALRYGRPAYPGGTRALFDDVPLPLFAVALLVLVVGVGGAFVGGGACLGELGGVVVGFGATIALGYRRIGGVTGDVLGAAGVVGETLGLLIGGVRW